MEIKIGSLVKFHTILLLNDGPKHGYELMKKLEDKLGKKVSTSQVYPFLLTLEKNKLIRIKKKGYREKKVYNLTNKGKKFVGNLLARFGDMFEIAIKPKLNVCTHCNCKVYSGGYKQRIGNRLLVFCCRYCADACK